ncbi:hypothetical protein PMAYCL1PPCAC_17278, partial [Pristionchus mayeri]
SGAPLIPSLLQSSMLRLLLFSSIFAVVCFLAISARPAGDDDGFVDQGYDELSAFGYPDVSRRGHHGHHFPWYPPFLRNVSASARREFFRIIFDRNATKGEIKKRVGEWAVKNHVEEQVKAYHEKIVAYFTEHHKNVTAAIGKLQGAYESLTSIIKDDSLTRHQTYVKLHDLFVSYPRELRALLYATRPLPPRRRPHEYSGEDYSDEMIDSSFPPLSAGLKFKGVGAMRTESNRAY